MMRSVTENLAEMSVQITANTNAIKELKGEEVTPEETEEYPKYVQPTGTHDACNTGDKVTYNGKKYTCLMDGCVWNPDTYPQGWEAEE